MILTFHNKVKRYIRLLLFSLIIVSLFPTFIYSNSKFIKSIKSCYDTSSLKRASDERLKSKKANTYLSIADYLPSVTGEGEFWQHNDDILNGKFKEQEYTIEGTLTQPILDISRITNIIEASKNLKIEKQNFKITNQNNLRNLIFLWVNYSHNRKIFNLSKQADSLASMHLQATEKRFESGDLTKTDVFQAQTQYYSSNSIRHRDSISLNQIERFIYTNFGDIATNSIDIPQIRQLFTESKNIDSIVETLPEIIILKEKYKIAKANIINSATRNIPKLNAIGEISRNWDKSISYKPYPFNDMTIGLKLSMIIWSSGKTTAEIISSTSLKKEEKLLLSQIKEDKKVEVQNAYLQIQKFKTQVDNFLSAKNAAEKSLEGITIEFNIGNRNSVDVLNAQEDLTEIMYEYEKSRKALFLSYIDLFYLLGTLDINTLEKVIIEGDS